MKKFVVMLLLAVILLIQGCAALDALVMDDRGNVKEQITDTTNAGVELGAAVATVNPVGYIISGVSGVIAALAGAYAEMRRKQANTANDSLDQTKVVLDALVKAIEDTAEIQVTEDKTVKDLVKEKVTDKLHDKDFYKIGKAIIEAIKNA